LIVNIASVEHAVGPGPLAPTVIVQSNAVVTPVVAGAGLSVSKSSEPSGSVPPGTVVTFRLLVENPHATDLTGVVITDPIDPLLGDPTDLTDGAVADLAAPGGAIPVSASYDPTGRTITWDIAAMPAGARFELSFRAQVDAAAPDDSLVRNATTQVSLQDPAGTRSNEVLVPVVSPALSLSKQASRSRAEVGQPVGYTLEIGNVSAALDLSGVRVRDRVPRGLRYLEGSARLDGDPIPDPGRSGAELVFPVGDLAQGETRRVSYVAIPTPEADGRDLVNEAWADAITPAGAAVSAGPAQARVRVSGSLLSGEATIVGRVFVDDNRNGTFDEGEVGVPGARVYLEDGTFAFTDVVGKYHIEGVRPGLHVMKLDRATLPGGLGAFASWSRSAGGAGTQFVDVGARQIFKTNLATGGWGIAVARLTPRAVYRGHRGDERAVSFPPVLATALFEGETAQISQAARPLVEGCAALIRERGGRIASLEVEPSFYPLADGVLMSARAERLRAAIARLALAAAPAREMPPKTVASAPARSAPVAPVPRPAAGTTVAPASSSAGSAELAALEARVRTMPARPAVLSPPEGVPLQSERCAVEVTLPAGLTPRLSVNGQEIPAERIAVRMRTSLTRLSFFRYLGVGFREGRNRIGLQGIDAVGNARVRVEHLVDRLGPPRRIGLRAEAGTLRADGRTPAEIRVEVRDAQELPVADGTLVTLEVDSGKFLGRDAAPGQEGFQVAT
ncbi:MAG: hypothetical protein ACE5JG_10060, partial [Planctomycetota bacterium]